MQLCFYFMRAATVKNRSTLSGALPSVAGLLQWEDVAHDLANTCNGLGAVPTNQILQSAPVVFFLASIETAQLPTYSAPPLGPR